MKVSIIYEPDPDLGPDPLDEAAQPRSLGEFIDDEKVDVLVIWREYGDQFEDGSRTHVIPGGAWEHVTEDQVDALLDSLLDDGL